MKLAYFPGRRTVAVIAVLFLIIFAAATYVVTAPTKERFFELYVLGRDKTAGLYFPTTPASVPAGAPLSWYLGVKNDMGSVQLVQLQVMLGNRTSISPDQLPNMPSQLPLIANYTRVLLGNETWRFPFTWEINSLRTQGGSVTLNLYIAGIGNETSTISATDGKDFRMIVELWTYSLATHSMNFGWSSGGATQTAWVQVWFNTTAT